jgi:hypothetical protein
VPADRAAAISAAMEAVDIDFDILPSDDMVSSSFVGATAGQVQRFLFTEASYVCEHREPTERIDFCTGFIDKIRVSAFTRA